jgi:hypothetical protein
MRRLCECAYVKVTSKKPMMTVSLTFYGLRHVTLLLTNHQFQVNFITLQYSTVTVQFTSMSTSKSMVIQNCTDGNDTVSTFRPLRSCLAPPLIAWQCSRVVTVALPAHFSFFVHLVIWHETDDFNKSIMGFLSLSPPCHCIAVMRPPKQHAHRLRVISDSSPWSSPPVTTTITIVFSTITITIMVNTTRLNDRNRLTTS